MSGCIALLDSAILPIPSSNCRSGCAGTGAEEGGACGIATCTVCSGLRELAENCAVSTVMSATWKRSL
jgi:hypothetical protein